MMQSISGLMSLLQNANEIGARVQAAREELKAKRVVGSAGGGMVQVEANGLGKVLRVKIDPALFQRQDHEMAEDLLPAAINQALEKARELHLDVARTAANGFSLPGLDEALSKVMQR